MRKLLIAALTATVTALVPSAATAQTYGHHRQEQRQVNRERRQVNNERRRVNNERRQVNNERRRVNNEHRNEDWREYRRTHRDVFTRPRYVWPRGHSYRPLGVGAVLDRLFWGPQYRLNYYTYRLPYPGRYREWVRYGNDALLIDDRTGRIITVYRDFFY